MDTTDPLVAASDAALIDAVEATLREERRRGPTDLLAILAVLLIGSAVLLTAVAMAISDGPWRDLLLNLTGEAVGAALTVVVIGGFWARLQSSSVGTLDDLQRLVGQRRSGPLTPEERTAFLAIVDLHRRTQRSGPVLRVLEGTVFAVRHRRKLRVLEDMLRHGGIL